MDAPKKFGVRSFLDRIRALQQEHGVQGTAVCSTDVVKRSMVVFDYPKSDYDTLKELASC